MGRVDLFDQMVASYRVQIRSKHWWWPFFAWSLNAAMTDAWLLIGKLHNNSISFLQFEREIALTILASGQNAVLLLLPYSRNVANNI